MNIDEILAETLSLREEAKKYTKQNVSIIPVGKNKVPLIPWKEFTERIATDTEIDSWFDKFPEAQLGAVTGKISRMTVVDVEAEGGVTTWSKFPQDGPISQTGGGGRHYFFQYEPGVKNAVRILENVDLRGDGGYVVFPPSSSDKGRYSWIQQAPLPPFPRKFFNIPDDYAAIHENKIDAKKITDIFLQTAVLQFEGRSTGGRNDEMTRFIGLVLGQVHPLKWDELAWPAIVIANQKNTPPLPEFELRNSFESIKRSEIANNPLRWQKKAEIKPWEAVQNGEDDIVLMSEAASKQKIDISTFFPLGVDIFDKEIMGGVHLGDLIAIAGMPGEGKTSWAMNLTKNFIKQGHKVLFFSYEMLVQMVWEKFKLMGVQDTDMVYCPFKTVTGSVEWIEKKIKEAKEKLGVKFVVIDHLSFLTGKMNNNAKLSENYSVALTNIVRDLKDIAKNEEVIIILPVHVRKQGLDFKKNADLDLNSIAHTAGVAQLSDLVFMLQREKHKDKGAIDIYTGFTSIAMVKNRWGHRNPKGYFEMINEQFIFNKNYSGLDNLGKSRGYENQEEKESLPAFMNLENKPINDLKDELFESNSDMYATAKG